MYSYSNAGDALRNTEDFWLLLERGAEAGEVREIHRAVIERGNAVIRKSLQADDAADEMADGDAEYDPVELLPAEIERLAILLGGLIDVESELLDPHLNLRNEFVERTLREFSYVVLPRGNGRYFIQHSLGEVGDSCNVLDEAVRSKRTIKLSL